MASGVLLGLAAAFCWGTADFCLRGATHAAGTFRALLFMQLTGLLAITLGIEVWRPMSFAGATPGLLAEAVGLNLAILVGAALLYRAFAIGTLAIVSPIAASFGALTAALALLSGERPSAPQLLGIGLAIAGVTLTGSAPGPAASPGSQRLRHARRLRLAPGVPESLGATVIFGVCYWALRPVVAHIGGLQVVYIGKIAESLALALIVAAMWGMRAFTPRPAFAATTGSHTDPLAEAARPLAPRAAIFWAWLIPGALLDTAANTAYNLGIAGALTSVVAPLSSLFTAVTVLLAWLLLRERLGRLQWAGVCLILVGVALVNL